MNSSHPLPPEIAAWAQDRGDEARNDLETAWHVACDADPLLKAPTVDATRIDRIKYVLQAEAQQSRRTPLLRLLRSGRGMAIAAMIVLLMGVGIFLGLSPISHHAPSGETLSATLPDGSSVLLNSGTTLSYARWFGIASRDVKLEGEAFFSVEKSATPFVVQTFNARVEVLGTEFNVRARPSEIVSQSVVTVASGRVQIADVEGENAVLLVEGQYSAVGQDRLLPSAPLASYSNEALAWREGHFIFFDQPYDVIFNELERRYDVQILASHSLRAQHRTWSHKHSESKIQDILEEICQAAQLRYRATANGFEIFE